MQSQSQNIMYPAFGGSHAAASPVVVCDLHVVRATKRTWIRAGGLRGQEGTS